jgi:hypothetical protein
MTEYTEEDHKVARQILDFQRLLHADMLVAFPDGIQRYHLTAMAGSFLEMLLKIEQPAQRQRMWEVIQMGINQRFTDGRL